MRPTHQGHDVRHDLNDSFHVPDTFLEPHPAGAAALGTVAPSPCRGYDPPVVDEAVGRLQESADALRAAPADAERAHGRHPAHDRPSPDRSGRHAEAATAS